jgi:endonuclease/exonuclease/phosphatase family metal-dependent hydrolase
MAELIIRQVDNDGPDRAVLLGDFYMDDESAAYRVIKRKFRDAWLGAHHSDKDCDSEGYTNKTMHPTQRDDYVFVTDGFRVDGARVTCRFELLEAFGLTKTSPNVELRVPDHLPVTVHLVF